MPVGTAIGLIKSSEGKEIDEVTADWGVGVGILYAIFSLFFYPLIATDLGLLQQLSAVPEYAGVLGLQSFWIVPVIAFVLGIAETFIAAIIYKFLEKIAQIGG